MFEIVKHFLLGIINFKPKQFNFLIYFFDNRQQSSPHKHQETGRYRRTPVILAYRPRRDLLTWLSTTSGNENLPLELPKILLELY